MLSYVKRLLGGFWVGEETLAVGQIKKVGHRGNHLGQAHTVKHLQAELWMPTIFARSPWDSWMDQGGTTLAERAAHQVQEILDTHKPEPMDEALAAEIDGIVESARKHLL
jgi:trimethylamine--corrinoid protein Co-methyltransferase